MASPVPTPSAPSQPLLPTVGMPRTSLARTLLVVLVVFLLPPLLLDFLARRLLEEEERHLAARQEQSLLASLRTAQAGLAPEHRLAVAIERVVDRLGWGPRVRGRPRRPAPGHPDAGSPREVLDRLRPLLRRQIPAAPLAIWVVGANARRGVSYGDPRFYQGPAPFGETAVRTLMAGWLGLLDRRPWGATHDLESFRQRWEGPAGRRAFREHRGKVGTHLFGEFLPLEIDLRLPDSFFCSRFGTGRVWLAGGALTDGTGPDAPLLGAFVVFYRDADLPRSFLLAGARGPRRRLITLARNGIPRFTRTAGRLTLTAPLPFEFQPAIRRGAMTPGRDGPVRMLQVWLPSDDRTHPFRRRLAQVELGLGLWAIAGGLVFWGMATGHLALPLPIRGQLALALATAVLPPALACGLFAHSFLGFWRAEGERAAREILGQSLRMLESGMAGHVNGEQEKVWLAKERLSPLLTGSSDTIMGELDRILSSSQGQAIHLIRADGEEWFRSAVFPGVPPIPPETTDKMVSLARVLAVRLFQAYNRGTWETDRDRGNPAFWSKEQLAVARQIWRPDEFAVYLAKDPLPLDARSTGFRDGMATGFLLWEPLRQEVPNLDRQAPAKPVGAVIKPRPDRHDVGRASPLPPVRTGRNTGFADGRAARRLAGILFLSRQTGAIGRPYFSGRLAADWARDRQHPDLSVQTAVFPCTRGTSEGSWRLQTTPCWPPAAAQDRLLVQVARQACSNPWSVHPPLPDGRLVATRVFQSFPYVAVGVGRMTGGMVGAGGEPLFVTAGLAYLMSLVWLASRFLERIFLLPMDRLAHASLAVAGGDYTPSLELPGLDEFTQVGKEFCAMCKGLREGRLLRRFVSSDAALDARGTGTAGFEPGGERRRVAVLFTHIRDFPRLTAGRAPDQVFSWLNQYFSAMEAPIRAHQGAIDKFIGDAVMVVFHELPGQAPAARRAWAAACGMRRALRNLNLRRQGLGHPPLSTGLGLAAGEAVSGRIGSRHRRLDFTVIGDTVNLAARLEALRDRAPTDAVILDRATAAAIGLSGQGQPLGDLAIKGKARPVPVVAYRPEATA